MRLDVENKLQEMTRKQSGTQNKSDSKNWVAISGIPLPRPQETENLDGRVKSHRFRGLLRRAPIKSRWICQILDGRPPIGEEMYIRV